VPYLWGGCSPFGFDCSGLAQAFLAFMGVAAPRDASQQFRAGRPVTGTPQPGDLLFFGESVDDDAGRVYSGGRQAITHVAISLGGDEIIHANGTAVGISYNSLNPERPAYRSWLREHLAGVRRFTEIPD
jgi:cell wall-associated NlpC family hydrolase